MRLSSDYSRVAIFEYRADDVGYEDTGEEVESEFQVGPFVYKVYFSKEEYEGDRTEVQFELVDIDTSDAELVQMFSKVAGREVSVAEAKAQARKVLDSQSQLLVGLMEPYAKQIFGSIIGIVQNYVSQYHPRCIEFNAVGQKRANIYHGMVKRAFPGAKVEMHTFGKVVFFIICQG